MKEHTRNQPPELPSSQFGVAAHLCQYIQSVRGIDTSRYAGELLFRSWGEDAAYVGFETLQVHRPTGDELPLQMTCTIALPTLQGTLTIGADWIQEDPGEDTMQYVALDGQSTIHDAVLVVSDLCGMDLEPRRLFELPYRSLDLATHRMDTTHMNGAVTNKNGVAASWEIAVTHNRTRHEIECVRSKRLLQSWSQMRWRSNGTVSADSQNGSTPREDTILKHLWTEASACISDETPEGRPLYPMSELVELSQHNLDAVLARAGEFPL